MQIRSLVAVLCTGVLLACGPDTTPGDADPATIPEASSAEADRADLFVDAAAVAGGQLVFVGDDRSILRTERTDAVFVPYSTFSVERDGIPNEFPEPDSMAALLEAAGVRGDRFVIVGEPIPAGRAFAAFDYLGLGDRAALLDGGPAALSTAPSTGARPPGETPGELNVAVRDDMIVDAEWVMERIDDANVVILDARPPAEFTGETPGVDIERPGHIPGARNVFWQTLVQSPDETSLRDETELRRIFEAAGVGPDDTVVAYCRTGGQAGFLYAVARHLGYDVRLYDGSFVEWSRTDYPVER